MQRSRAARQGGRVHGQRASGAGPHACSKGRACMSSSPRATSGGIARAARPIPFAGGAQLTRAPRSPTHSLPPGASAAAAPSQQLSQSRAYAWWQPPESACRQPNAATAWLLLILASLKPAPNVAATEKETTLAAAQGLRSETERDAVADGPRGSPAQLSDFVSGEEVFVRHIVISWVHSESHEFAAPRTHAQRLSADEPRRALGRAVRENRVASTALALPPPIGRHLLSAPPRIWAPTGCCDAEYGK